MSWETGALSRLRVIGAAVLVAGLAACQTTTTTTGSGVPTVTTGPSSERSAPGDQGESDASKRARVRMELASAYFSRGQMNTALDEVKLVIAADPNLGAAYNLRGLIYANMGEHQLAEENFRRALQIDARDADAMQNYGWYLCQQKRYPEADALFRQALGVPQYRDAPRTLLTQGICQARSGQWAQAEATLLRSYELDPVNPATAVNLSEVLYQRGEYERARFYIRRVNNNQDIANAQTLWLAARIENKLGNRQGVQDLGTQIRNRFPQSREAVAIEQGKFDE